MHSTIYASDTIDGRMLLNIKEMNVQSCEPMKKNSLLITSERYENSYKATIQL